MTKPMTEWEQAQAQPLWTPCDWRLNIKCLVTWPPGVLQLWLLRHDAATLKRMLTAWNIWAREDQTPPEGDWRSWLFLGGRGAGKTRAGAEWVKSLMAQGVRVALIGPTLHDVREVMIDGPSGLRNVSDPGARPFYEVSRRRLRWPGGGVAYAFSAEEPERLRGPQFHYAWADEFCAWRAPAETLAQLRMGLRLGETPRLCVTTTPKPIAALKALMTEDGAALWRADDLARCYGARPPAFDEVIVAVDPPASSHGDACGIVAAGRVGERGYVLCDATVSGLSPLGWARQAAAVAREHGAHQIVAEANQGGEMVRTLLAQAGCAAPIRLVHARDGKRRRAEPVAALYEQGRVTHCPGDGGRFNALDEELMALGSGAAAHSPARSPDRADALVWALTMLLLDGRAEPRLRRL